ncbi:hypothetical protein GOP47_0007597 [Adiantum capillus-veneris]|uniref:LOB domain-containing protein n=1 Tax=Adiantum capillus-veneris TaxID=13818 RepID=A0A9D4V172_ADICA|nr:hypothetical protein GOP47_0007597 [Adiantum capillus-veneris]
MSFTALANGPSSHVSSPSGSYSSGGGGSTSTTAQACAACKFQRRKCLPDCPLAPYFPADQPKQFLNVHKLYGVSNTLRILKQVDPSKREDAMKSILYEAAAWDRDPVHGCYGIITLLQAQAEMLREELDYVRTQLRIHQQQQILAAAAVAGQATTVSTSYGQLQPLSSNNLSSVNAIEDYVSPACMWQQQLSASPASSPTSTNTPSWLHQYMVSSPRCLQSPRDTAVTQLDSGFLNFSPQILALPGSSDVPPKASVSSFDVRPSLDTRSVVDYEPAAQSSFNCEIKNEHAYESSAESSAKEVQSAVEQQGTDPDLQESATALLITYHSS